MPRLLFCTDWHYSQTPPECRGPDYAQTILAKLHEVAYLANNLKTGVIAVGGDILHRKGRVTFAEVNDVLAILSSWKARGLEPIGILGNHDCPMGPESMDIRGAGALHHSRALRLVEGDPYWITSRIEPVRDAAGRIQRTETGDLAMSHEGNIYVTGTSYFHDCDATDENRIKMYGAKPPEPQGEMRDYVHVHLAHGALMLNGDFPSDFTPAEELIPVLREAGMLPDVILCGHMHFRQGIREFDRPDGKGKVTVCCPGSLGRVSRDDLDRIPNAILVATKGRKWILKEYPIGLPAVVSSPIAKDDPRDPREHEERIRIFTKELREQGETVSLSDNAPLLAAIAEKLGHDQEVTDKAVKAVQTHE